MHYENCSMKNALTASAKSFLALSGLTEAGSATDVVFQKKLFGSGMKKSITSNEEMDDIMIIVKSLEDSGL